VPEERDSSTSEPALPRRVRPPVELPSGEPLRKRAVPYVLFVGFAAILGLSSEAIRSVEAVVLAATFPLAILYLGLGALRAMRSLRVARAAIAVALLSGITVEALLYREFFPPAPLGRVTLTPTEPDATVPVPDDTRSFEVIVHGRLRGESGDAEARYAIDLKRGDRLHKLEGEMVRHEGRAPRRSVTMMRSAGSTAIESGRHGVVLDAAGPVTVHLGYLGNAAHKAIDVTFYHRALAEGVVATLFGLLLVAGFASQAAAFRAGVATRLTASIAIAGVYTIYVQRYLDVDDPLLTVFPAMVVSFVVGGVTGLVLGRLAAFFKRRETSKAAR